VITRRLEPGILVAIEGIDGAGKTTQAKRLADVYRSDGFTVVTEKEPTDGPWGQRLRASAISGRHDPEEEANLFIEDRRDHVERIIGPALEAGSIVIVDRYFLSNVAYQGARGVDPEGVLRRNEEFAPAPDVAVILEIDPEVGAARIRARGDTQNHFEGVESLRQVAAQFAAIQRPYIQVIDGAKPIETITNEILRLVADGPLFRRLCAFDYRPSCEPMLCSVRIAGNCPFPGLNAVGQRVPPDLAGRINGIALNESLDVGERLRAITALLQESLS
jgi:dTMP kinase